MKNVLTIVLCLCLSMVSAQQDYRGKVAYRSKTNWIKISQALPWLSNAEKQRMEYTSRQGKSEYKGALYELDYYNNKSVYQRGEDENASGYSWAKSEFKLVRDYKKKTADDRLETLDQKFNIQDYPTYKWKIRNEIKKIAGYLCMKAETVDPVKGHDIAAWFTTSIPIQAGPDGYHGLPGLILEIDKNNGSEIIQAEKVELLTDDTRMPKLKKFKGKKMTTEEFSKVVKEFIDESMENERNPFWSLRY